MKDAKIHRASTTQTQAKGTATQVRAEKASQLEPPKTATVVTPEIPHRMQEQLSPKGGKPPSNTASADALWGVGTQPKDPAQHIRQMSPAERAQNIEKLKKEKAHLEDRIHRRVEDLDERFGQKNYKKRIEMLETYLTNAEVPLATRQKLQGMVADLKAAQARIDGLLEKAKTMPRGRDITPEQKEARREMAREILAARAEQRETLEEASEELEAAGLKVDMLAAVEQILAPDSGDTLAGLLKQWFAVSQSLAAYDVVIANLKRSVDQAREARLEDEKRVQIETIDRNTRLRLLLELSQQIKALALRPSAQ